LELLFSAALLGAAASASAWGLWRGWRLSSSVLLGALAPALLMAALLVGATGPEGRPYYQQMRSEARVFFESQSAELLKSGQVPADRIEASRAFLEKFYVELLPGWMASLCLLLGWVGTSLSGRLLSKLSSRVASPPPFQLFVWPEPFVFGLIVSIGILAVAPLMGDRAVWGLVGGCLLVLFGTAYFMVGLAITTFFFGKWKLHPFLRLLLYVALFMTPSSVPALSLLGVLDLWVDFRKLKPVVTRETPGT
jgi:hypothetical protein